MRASSLLSEIAIRKDIRIWGGADVEDFWPLGGADVEDFGGADVEWITFMSPCADRLHGDIFCG